MIDLSNGNILVNLELVISPNLAFRDFMKSKYYSNQNEKRIVNINEALEIDGLKWHISLFFQNSVLKTVFLMIHDEKLTEWEDEPKRKTFHDNYLRSKGILNNSVFNWGEVMSEFDSKSCTSHIIISYN